MSGYKPKHARGTDPAVLAEVSAGLAGMADKIQIVPSEEER